MQTRLGLFCDKVIEAGLLATAAIVPVFFNVFSERTFEPDKAALLRSLVLLMAVAWLIRAIESRVGLRPVSGLRSQVSGPTHDLRPATCDLRLETCDLRLLALLLAAVYCLSTLLSVAPSFSLWGSYQRAQGLYTLLSYIGVFFLAVRFLKTWEQIERLITAVLLTSVPITLYALLQQFGLDPQGWGGPQAGRVFSTLGNPIFLGGYLITVTPITVARILQTITALRRDRASDRRDFVQIGALSLLLILQLVGVIFAQSRGPLVGLLGGAILTLLLIAVLEQRRRMILAFLLAVGALAVLLVLLNVLAGPSQGFGDVSYLGRFGQLLNPQSATAQQRIWTWQGVVDLVGSDLVRAVIGYGPDTLIVTFNRYFPPELVSLPQDITVTYDRAHNVVLDTVATSGALGLAAYLCFLGTIVYHSLERLGLVASSAERRAFLALVTIGSVLGVLASWLAGGSWRLSGLGLSAGGILALAVFLLGRSFIIGRAPDRRSAHAALLIALLAGIMAHFIEIQFGIAIVPTLLHFWLFSAIIVWLARESRQGKTGQQAWSRGRKDETVVRATAPPRLDLWTWMGWDPARAPESLLIGLLLATLGFGLITDPALLRSRSVPLVLLFAVISLFCHSILGSRSPRASGTLRKPAAAQSDSASGESLSIVGNAVLSVSWGLVFLIAHVLGIALLDDGTGSLTVYYMYVLLTVVAVAASLLQGEPRPEKAWNRRAVPLYLGLVLAAVWLAVVSNLNVVKADIYYKQALAYGEVGRWDESAMLFERAVGLAPQQDFYAILTAGAYVQKAYLATTADERERWLETAEARLTQGWRQNPLYPDHSTKLGLLYRLWGEMSSDPVVRRKLLDQAEERYAEAAGLSPNSIPVLNGWAMTHIALENYDQAEAILEQSVTLRPSVVETHLLLGDTHLAQGRVEDAATAYAQGIALNANTALSFKQNAVQSAPSDPVPRLRLALIYRELGQQELALREAQTAERLAGGELAALAEVLASLEKQ